MDRPDFHQLAERELNEAAQYYDVEEPGLGLSFLQELDPLGSEIQKTRPCLVVSPDELNQHLRTVIIAPMTTTGARYPWRVPCRFQRRSGFVVLDQIRTVD